MGGEGDPDSYHQFIANSHTLFSKTTYTYSWPVIMKLVQDL